MRIEAGRLQKRQIAQHFCRAPPAKCMVTASETNTVPDRMPCATSGAALQIARTRRALPKQESPQSELAGRHTSDEPPFTTTRSPDRGRRCGNSALCRFLSSRRKSRLGNTLESIGVTGFEPATSWSRSAPGIEAKTGKTRHLSDHIHLWEVVNTYHRYPRFTDVSQVSVVGKW